MPDNEPSVDRPGDAFVRALEVEVEGALVDSWYWFLRWLRVGHYGASPLDDELRAEARERAARRELPAWPDYGEAAFGSTAVPKPPH